MPSMRDRQRLLENNHSINPHADLIARGGSSLGSVERNLNPAKSSLKDASNTEPGSPDYHKAMMLHHIAMANKHTKVGNIPHADHHLNQAKFHEKNCK